MVSKKLIGDLNENLKREHTTLLQYVNHAYTATGLHRLELAEFWWKSSQEELKHARALADYIVGLGGVPTTEIGSIKVGSTNEEMLKDDLEAEREAIAEYEKRIQLAEKENQRSLTNLLENILLDEQKHAYELEKLLKK